jgi:hypothetical protein
MKPDGVITNPGNLKVSSGLTVGGAGQQDLGGPGPQTRINDQGIIFGGANNGREGNSAQISAGRHEADSLCMVGMSKPDGSARKITMWSEGGTKHYGDMYVSGNMNTGGRLTSNYLTTNIGGKTALDVQDGGLVIGKGTSKWILHTPDDGRRVLYIAPLNAAKTDWDWNKNMNIDENGNVTINGNLTVNGNTNTTGGVSAGNKSGNVLRYGDPIAFNMPYANGGWWLSEYWEQARVREHRGAYSVWAPHKA